MKDNSTEAVLLFLKTSVALLLIIDHSYLKGFAVVRAGSILKWKLPFQSTIQWQQVCSRANSVALESNRKYIPMHTSICEIFF